MTIHMFPTDATKPLLKVLHLLGAEINNHNLTILNDLVIASGKSGVVLLLDDLLPILAKLTTSLETIKSEMDKG